jgi:hypothetical protein
MKLISDKYQKARGGYSRLLKVSCERCNELICVYQKDGPGQLRRMYSDRILQPKISWKLNQKLVCRKCKKWLGIAVVFKKEKRKCFIMFQDVINKRVTKFN